VRIDPPKEVVAQILGMIGEWPFPPLSGVVGCPTLRRDGSLLTNEGYDFATGLVLHNSVEMPPISECPAPEDAKPETCLHGEQSGATMDRPALQRRCGCGQRLRDLSSRMPSTRFETARPSFMSS
jgi:hypothetical protein